MTRSESLVKNIKELRRERGLTQKAVATGLNIAKSTYAHYEQGRRRIDLDMISRIAEHFGVSFEYLIRTREGGTTA